MNRRKFMQLSTAGFAGVALSKFPSFAAEMAEQRKRVGLIGTGWYGKVDLLRLIQVAPVEVVSLCDVDKRMLAEAAEIVAGRQLSKKKPRTYGDYREMLKEKDLDLVLIDGGPGQLHAAAEAIAATGAKTPLLVSLAKRQEEVYVLGRAERQPLRLARTDPALKVLQAVRDEAHRFAQHYHHLLRRKAVFGEKTARDLAAHRKAKKPKR
jgi:hypothetical protein